MKLANDLNNILEGRHQNTKVKQTSEQAMGSRKIRLTLKAAYKAMENMMNEKHHSPNPANKDSKLKLHKAMKETKYAMEDLKVMKDSKKRKA